MRLLFVAVLLAACDQPEIVIENTPQGQRSLVMAKAVSRDSLQAAPGKHLLLRRIAPNEKKPIEFAVIQLSSPRSDGSVEYRCAFRDGR
jgi:hypothetical protein